MEEAEYHLALEGGLWLSELTHAWEVFEEQGKVVSSVCHGYCGLLNTRLSDGTLLVAGIRHVDLTSFSVGVPPYRG